MNKVEVAKTWVPLGVAAGIVVSAVGATWSLATDRAEALYDIRAVKECNMRQDAELKEVRCAIKDIAEGIRRLELQNGTASHGATRRMDP